MSRRARIVALALPLFAVALGIVRAELFLQDAQSFVVEIEGYDPRDVLRGRYLQFRIRLDVSVEDPTCVADHDACCVCLARAGGDAAHATRMQCAAAQAQCDAVLSMDYLRQPMRYYVPEEHARALERRLMEAMRRRTAHAVLAVDPKGDARVLELRVDGEPMLP